jgi:hypothetical protein
VFGYRVTRPDTSVVTCYSPVAVAVWNETSCVDLSPQYGGQYRVQPIYQTASGASAFGPAATVGPFSALQLNQFFLRTTSTTGTNCPNSSVRELSANPPTTAASQGMTQISTWCSTVNQALAYSAGTTKFDTVVQNTANGTQKDCDVTAALRINGATFLGSRIERIENKTNTALPLTFNIPHSAFAVPAGSRLHLTVSGQGNGCSTTTISWSAAAPSKLTLPDGVPAPITPRVTFTGGAAELSWTSPPVTSGELWAFRIYRGGTDLRHRIGRTGTLGEATYVDSPSSSGQEYWITTVNDELRESAPVKAAP